MTVVLKERERENSSCNVKEIISFQLSCVENVSELYLSLFVCKNDLVLSDKSFFVVYTGEGRAGGRGVGGITAQNRRVGPASPCAA